jgi:hypothetical protein
MKLMRKNSPTPGIEPGPPAWEAGILTTRPYGTYYQTHVKAKKYKEMNSIMIKTECYNDKMIYEEASKFHLLRNILTEKLIEIDA